MSDSPVDKILDNKSSCTALFLFSVTEYSIENMVGALLLRRWQFSRTLAQAELAADICFFGAVLDLNLSDKEKRACLDRLDGARKIARQQYDRIRIGSNGKLNGNANKFLENWICPGDLFATGYNGIGVNLADTIPRMQSAMSSNTYQQHGFSLRPRLTFERDYLEKARQILSDKSQKETVKLVRHVFTVAARAGIDLKGCLNYTQIGALLE